MASTIDKSSVRHWMLVFFRRWRLFLLAFSAVGILVLATSHLWPLKYTGTTTFEHRTDAATDQNMRKGAAESFETIKLALKQELTGTRAIEQVVDKLDLTRGMPRDANNALTQAGEMAKQQLVHSIEKRVELSWPVRTESVDLVTVSYTDPNPLLAQQVPDALVNNYMNAVSERIKDGLTASRDFLLKQVQVGEANVTDLNNKKIEFETKHASSMPDSPGALAENIQQINSDMDTLRRQQSVARQTLARLGDPRQTTSSPTSQPLHSFRGPNPEFKRIKTQLQAYTEQLDDSLTVQRMTENHPTIKSLRSKIAKLEGQLKDTPEEATLEMSYAGPDSASVQSDMAAAQSEMEISARELERLQSRLDSYQNLMSNFAPIRQEYMDIINKLEKEKAEAQSWKTRLSEVQSALTAEVAKRRTHLNTVQMADKQYTPSFPPLWLILSVTIVGGLGFGAGTVFLTNTLDRSISTVEEAAEHFTIPIRGVIGEISSRQALHRRQIINWVITPILIVVILVGFAVSTLSVVLWLKYPQEYRQWKDARSGLVMRVDSQPVSSRLS